MIALGAFGISNPSAWNLLHFRKGALLVIEINPHYLLLLVPNHFRKYFA